MKTLISRRVFLKGFCLVSTSWAVKDWSDIPILPYSSLPQAQISETRSLMGTFVTITLFHSSRELAQAVLGEAFNRMEQWIQIFNRHEDNTALSYLNERGFINCPPPELVEVIRQSMMIHQKTHGAFDITIKPVLDLYEAGYELGRLPNIETVKVALKRVDATKVEIASQRIAFRREGMGITLDGIAKGTIVDRTISFIQKKGIQHALVDAGGDLRVIGGRSKGQPWRIAVYDPIKGTSSREMILLMEGAVATSGSYMVYYDRDMIHHHILSPETGESPPWSVSATVIAPTTEEADALATSLMVLAPEEGQRLVNRDEFLASMVITKKDEEVSSSKWSKLSKGA